jgi:hypothetical protein
MLFYFTNYPKIEKLKNSMETLNNEEEQVIFITLNAPKKIAISVVISLKLPKCAISNMQALS